MGTKKGNLYFDFRVLKVNMPPNIKNYNQIEKKDCIKQNRSGSLVKKCRIARMEVGCSSSNLIQQQGVKKKLHVWYLLIVNFSRLFSQIHEFGYKILQLILSLTVFT